MKTIVTAVVLMLAFVAVCSAACIGTPFADNPGSTIQAKLDDAPSMPGPRHIVLCPNSRWQLTSTLRFPADANDTYLYTEGLPNDDSRALLYIVNTAFGTAVRTDEAYWDGTRLHSADNAQLRSLRVDGGLTRGYPMCTPGQDCWDNQQALIRMGGPTSGQIIDSVKAWGSRTTSTIFFQRFANAETVAYHNGCKLGQITNNEVRDAGTNEWRSDGIRVQCAGTDVLFNLVVDVSDVGIAIFGSPGEPAVRNTTVRYNTVETTGTRDVITIGGISMVDLWAELDGNMTGLEVFGNTIRGALGAGSAGYIKEGIAMGRKMWCEPYDIWTYGASVRDNVLEGTMGYGFLIDGVYDWTFTGNTSSATHLGVPGGSCSYAPCGTRPPVAKYVIHQEDANGTFQTGWISGCLHALDVTRY